MNSGEWRDKLKAGRAEMKRRCIDVALAETPTSVHLIVPRNSLTGTANLQTGVIKAPKPFTRKALYIFLHELAHIVLRHDGKKPRHVEEYEAERWAHERMRRHGLSVPRQMTKRAKRYVAHKIAQATVRGAKRIDRKARLFAGNF